MASSLVCDGPALSLDASGLSLVTNIADNFANAQYNAGGWAASAGSGFGDYSSPSNAGSSNCNQAQVVVQTISPFVAPPTSVFTM